MKTLLKLNFNSQSDISQWGHNSLY